MENNDSNIRPQQTGGLKLMTVFIAVLALHVVVIGGFTVYHLMSGGTDADTLTDKTHKNAKSDDTAISDGSLPESNPSSASATNASTPATDQTASTDGGNPQSAVSTAANSNRQPTASVPTGPVIDPPPVSAPAPSTMATTEPATQPAFEPAPMVSGAAYVVREHDSLAKIAHRNHTSVAKLKTANGLTSDVLHIGQRLVIPAHTEIATAPVPSANQDASGSTTILGDTASTPSMSVPATAPTTAPTAVAVHEQTTTAPVMTGHHLYTVMKGDTLTKIARKFKTTPTAIMTANNITDPSKLSIGKKLKIPGQEARSATTTQTPAASQPGQVQAKPATTAQLANFLQ